jgi:hypothetical protein
MGNLILLSNNYTSLRLLIGRYVKGYHRRTVSNSDDMVFMELVATIGFTVRRGIAFIILALAAASVAYADPKPGLYLWHTPTCLHTLVCIAIRKLHLIFFIRIDQRLTSVGYLSPLMPTLLATMRGRAAAGE